VHGEFLDTLVRLQLRFEHGALLVAASWEGDLDTENMIYTCLLHLWKFTKFTSSRWTTLGSSSRSLLASTVVGLEDLVHYIMEDKANSTYYIKGFSLFDQKVHELVAVMGSTTGC
jgi:hypothetical protein